MTEYMHNASIGVKAKRIYDLMQIAHMKYDDRPEAAKRLEMARKAAGFENARQAALRHNFVYETYIQHENGTRGITRAAKDYASAFHVSEGWLRTGEGAGPGSLTLSDAELFAALNREEMEDVKKHARGLLALRAASGERDP